MISDFRLKTMKKSGVKMNFSCPFNDACSCEKRQCTKCGWNPVVATQRTEAIEKQWRSSNG